MKFLCKYLGGSHLYGLNTPESDLDERGVYLSESLNSLWGFCRDDSKVTLNGTEDKCFFEFQRFLQLLKKTNTNTIECLFAPRNSFSVYTDLFGKVQENKFRLLNSKKLLSSLTGYMHNERRLLLISLMGYMHNERRLALGQRTGKLGGARREQPETYGYSPKKVVHMLRLSYCAETFFNKGGYPVRVKGTPVFDVCMDLKTNPENYCVDTVTELCDDALKSVDSLTDTLNYTFDDDLAVELLKEAYQDLLK